MRRAREILLWRRPGHLGAELGWPFNDSWGFNRQKCGFNHEFCHEWGFNRQKRRLNHEKRGFHHAKWDLTINNGDWSCANWDFNQQECRFVRQRYGFSTSTTWGMWQTDARGGESGPCGEANMLSQNFGKHFASQHPECNRLTETALTSGGSNWCNLRERCYSSQET
jgi:hypothetical protein